MDFVRSLRPKTSDSALVWTGRGATLAFMVLSALWAPQITQFPTLWQYLQSILAYVTPAVVTVFLLGIFWPRGNRQGAMATLMIGVPLGVVGWVLNEIFAVVRLQFLYASGLMLLASAVIFVVGSLLTAPPPKDRVEGNTWQRTLWQRETEVLAEQPWYTNYRIHAAVLLAITALLVLLWW